MLSIRFLALISLSAQLFWSGSLLAQDKVYKTTNSNATEGKITKVDDTQVFIQLGEMGGTAVKRTELKAVEIPKPAAYEQGLKAWKDGKNEEFIAAFEPIHNQYYGLPQAWIEDVSVKLGQAYLKSKLWAKAVDVFTKLEKFYPQSPAKDVAISGEGEAAYGMGDKAKASSILETLIKEREKNLFVSNEQSDGLGKACVVLGRCYLDSNKLPQALETFLKVPVLYYVNPDAVAEAEYQAALIYEKMNNISRAKSQLEELLNDYPQSPFAAQAKKKIDSLKT
jgi:outer membrane protein assembly factor BamD (BamD/ComL family)